MELKYKIKRFFRNIAIENLMTYIAASMAIIFVGDLFTDGMLSLYLSFDKAAILEGQVWRLITFLMLPDTASPIWIVFSVYFYYFIGKETENEWGSHNLTMYFLLGAALLIISGFVTGYTSASYLYFSLFLVYAHLDPHHRFMMFMVIPIEAKWMALIDAVFMLSGFIKAFAIYPIFPLLALGMQLSVVIAFLVYGIFFGKDHFGGMVNRFRHRDFYREMRQNRIKMSQNERDDDEK
ncbi:MAG: rhomboid family intramembrane serine protease [Huintestinicola sp.]|uniref:rhomboid family intramembrane serine protease n=1 Tax=Huintestinicola sp. TaxID=2981661 RepID=UPI003F027A15